MEIDVIKNVKKFAVIDTNVIISMTRNRFLFNGQVIKDNTLLNFASLIEKGNIIPIFDERMLSEYYFVLNYKKFGFAEIPEVIDNQMNLILSKGIFVKNVKELDIYFTDKTDIPFYEVMMDTSDISSDLVTGNVKHYPNGCCITPFQLIKQMINEEKQYGVFINTPEFEASFQEQILKMVENGKYYLGNVLPKEFIDRIEERKLSENEHINLDDYL